MKERHGKCGRSTGMAREDFVRMRHLTEVAGRATFQAKDQCRGPQVEELFSRSVVTLCDPMDCSLPGSSVLGILQARILEWVVISFSRGSS